MDSIDTAMSGINSMSANGDGIIRIPGQLWLEHAKFVREGPDLILIGRDGARIHIADYFRLERPPALQTDAGGTFTPELVAKLAGPVAPGQVAQAAGDAIAQPIGRIETISGPVEITRADGTRVTVQKGDAVFSGDVIETGNKAAVSMVLADDSVFSLADNGRIVLDEMVYDPSAQTGKLGMSLVTGVMSFVSGQIAKADPDAMVLSTPIATVGIRGTTGSVSSGNTLTIVMSRDPDGTTGEIIVSTPGGGTQVINTNLGGINIGANGAMQPFTMTPEQFNRAFGQSLRELSQALTSAGLGNGLPDANPTPSQDGPTDRAELDIIEMDVLIAEAEMRSIQINQAIEGIGVIARVISILDPVPPVVAPVPVTPPGDGSVQAQLILGIQTGLQTAGTVAGNADIAASSTTQVHQAQLVRMDPTGTMSATQMAEIQGALTAPLRSFGTSSAVSGTASGIQLMTLAMYKMIQVTGTTVTPIDPTLVAQMQAVSAEMQLVASKMAMVIDASTIAQEQMLAAALAAAAGATGAANKKAAAEAAMYGAGQMEAAFVSALATLSAARGIAFTLAELPDLMDNLIAALTAAKATVVGLGGYPEFVTAADYALEMAAQTNTAATNAGLSMTAASAADARSYSTLALEATAAVNDTLSDAVAALPIEELLAGVDATIVDEALAGAGTSEAAQIIAIKAIASIQAAAQGNVDIAALETTLATLQATADTKIATAAAERQEALDAAADVFEARVELASALALEATTEARADALEAAVERAEARLTIPLNQIFPASINLGPLDRTKSITELRDALEIEIGADNTSGLWGVATLARALADANPTNIALDTSADLAEQDLANARATLDFVEQIYDLFDAARATLETAYQDALTDFQDAHAVVVSLEAEIVTLTAISQTELSEALAAFVDAAQARANVAVAEVNLSIALIAKKAQIDVIIDMALEDATDAMNDAALALANGDMAAAQEAADRADEAADIAEMNAASPYASDGAADDAAEVRSYADAAAAYAAGQTPDGFGSFSLFAATAADSIAETDAAADSADAFAKVAQTQANLAIAAAASANTFRIQAEAAEDVDNAAAARTAAVAAATALAEATTAATAAREASRQAQLAAKDAAAALLGSDGTAIANVTRAAQAAARALKSEGEADAAEQRATNHAAEALASADLQSAEDEAAQLAIEARADAEAAANEAAEAAQDAADQAAEDKAEADAAAAALAQTFREEAEYWADVAAQKAAETEEAADNVDTAAAILAHGEAQTAAGKAVAAAQAAFDAAAGAGSAALAQAQLAATAASEAQSSKGSASASLDIAENSLSAANNWRDGSASADRLDAVSNAASQAAAAARALAAANTAATAAVTATANAVAPNVALAAAEAAVTSLTRSLANVVAKRAAADDGTVNTTAIEAVWDSAVSQAQGALADAESARDAAQAAANAANSAVNIANIAATEAAQAAASASANAAAASEQAGFAQSFEIGAQGAAQARADSALAVITEAVANAIKTAEAKAAEAADAAQDAEDAAADADAAAASAAAAIANAAADAAEQAVIDAVNLIVANAANLGLGTFSTINSLADAVSRLNSLAAAAEALDDLDIEASDPQPTQALLDAQAAADSAQAAKLTSLSASISSAVQAATAALASYDAAAAEAVAAAGDDTDRVNAAIKALDAAKAAADAAADKADAALQDAESALAAAQTRLTSTQAALAARDAAAESAKSAADAADRAEAALEEAETALALALTAKNEATAARDSALAGNGNTIDPAAYASLTNAFNAAVAAYNASSAAVDEAEAANITAQQAKTDAATHAATAATEAAKVSLSLATSAVSSAITARNTAAAAEAQAEARANSANALSPDGTPTVEEVRALVAQAEILAQQAVGFAGTAETAADAAEAALATAPRAVAARAAAQAAADAAAQAAATASGIAQVDTVTIAGTIENNDTYSITVNGETVTYTANGTETLAEVRDALVTLVNDADIGDIVAAASGDGNGQLTLTAQIAGVPFSAAAGAANGGGTNNNTATVSTTTGAASVTAETKQIDTITLAGTIENLDTYSVTINGTTVSYQATASDTLTSVATALVNLAKAQSAIVEDVTVELGDSTGEILVTAKEGGVEFDATAAASNGGGTNDNSATVTTVVANLKGADDIAAAAADTAEDQAEIAAQKADAAEAALAIVQKSIRANAIADAAERAAEIAELNARDDTDAGTANHEDALENLNDAKAAAVLAKQKADAAVLEFTTGGADPADLDPLIADARAAANDAATYATAAQTAATAARNALISEAQSLGLTPSAQTALAAHAAITAAANAIISDAGATSVAKALATEAILSVDKALASANAAQADATAAAQAANDADAQADLAENLDDLAAAQAAANSAAISSADQQAEASAQSTEASRSAAQSAASDAIDQVEVAMAATRDALSDAYDYLAAHPSHPDYATALAAINTAKGLATTAVTTIAGVNPLNDPNAGATVYNAITSVISSLDTALAGTHQFVTLNFTGTVSGQTFTVAVPGQATISINNATTLSGLRDSFVAALNAGAYGNLVTAQTGFADGEIRIYVDDPTSTLNITATSSNGTAPTRSTSSIDSALLSFKSSLTVAANVADTVQDAVADAVTAAATARATADAITPIPASASPDTSDVTNATNNAQTALAQVSVATQAADLARAQATQAQQAAKQAASGASQFEQSLEKANYEESLAIAQSAAAARPDAINDTASVNEDQTVTVSVLANDTRADGTALQFASITSIGAPNNGKVVVVPQVDTVTLGGTPGAADTYTITVNGKSVTYTVPSGSPDIRAGIEAAINNHAELKLIVRATDGASGEIRLTAVTPGIALDTSVSKNDIGSNNTQTVSVATTTANGSLVYTPNANFNGSDSFTYTVANNTVPPSFDVATVNISVAAVNDAPVLVADFGTVVTTAGTTVAVLANDTDVDGNMLSVASITYNGITHATTVTSNGVTITKNASGTVTYVPSASVLQALAQGQTLVDKFYYTLSDGTTTATGNLTDKAVTITLTGSNDAPIASTATITPAEDTAFTGTFNATDPDSGAVLTYSLAAGGSPLNGTVTISGNGYTYTPNANFSGSDSFTYRVVDQFNAASQAVITVNVTPVNDAPVAVADTGTAIEDAGVVTLNVLANDTDVDAGDSKFIVSATSAKGAAVTFGAGANATLSYNPNGVAQFNQLAQGQTTTDTVTYVMRDAAGATSQSTLTVTITGTNDAPVATATSFSTVEDTAFHGTLAGTDVDSGALLKFSVAPGGNPAQGTVAFKAQVDTITVGTSLSIETGDRITVTINGTSAQYTHSGGVNTPAGVAAGLTAFINANTTFSGLITAAMGASSGTVTLTSKVVGQQFTATTVSSEATVSIASTVANGSYTYTPNANYSGADTFNYRVVDQFNAGTQAAVTVTVSAVNDAPTANADFGAATEDAGAVTFAILANDTDSDAGDTASTFKIVSATSQKGAALTFDSNAPGGTLDYNPNGVAQFNALGAGQTTTDVVTYVMRDSTGATSQSTLTVTITGTNDNPVATVDAIDVTAGSGMVELDVLANDTDVDANDPVSAFTITAVGGAATISANAKSLLFDTNSSEFIALGEGQTEQRTVFYRMADGHGGVDNGSMTGVQAVVTIIGVNDGPVAVADTDMTNKATPIIFEAQDFLANDTDVDTGDTKHLVSVQSVSARGATITLNQDGTYTYNPTTSTQLQALGDEDIQTDTFTYVMRDAAGATSTATVTVTVNGSLTTDDTLTGTASNDTFVANGGDDTLVTGGGHDTFEIGEDYRFVSAAVSGTEDLRINYASASNPNILHSLTVLYHYRSGDGLAHVTFDDGDGEREYAVATALNSSYSDEDQIIVGRLGSGGKDIFGGSGDDLIFIADADGADGREGDDTIYGTGSADEFNASRGHDVIYGGGGGDTFSVSSLFGIEGGILTDADGDNSIDDLVIYFDDAPPRLGDVFDANPADAMPAPEGIESSSNVNLANQSFSWEFWGNIRSVGDFAAISHGDDTIGDALFIGYRDGKFVFSFDRSGSDDELTVAISAAEDDLDTWVHWAGSYDQTTGIRTVYRNGEIVAQDENPVDPYAPSAGTVTVGAYGGSDTQFDGVFDGYLGNVVLWDEVRSESNIIAGIQSALNTGANQNYATAHLAYRFGNVQGNIVDDMSPNGNDGTKTSGGAFVGVEDTVVVNSATFINHLGLNGQTAEPLASIDFTEYENNVITTKTYAVATQFDNSAAAAQTFIAGTNSNDMLIGGAYDDILIGNAGDDTIIAGAGNDFIIGGAGNDVIDGGAGIDTLNYSEEQYAVVVNLTTGIATNVRAAQDIETDTISGIENVQGTGLNDQLIGDASVNILRGERGDDLLVGMGGADQLRGGEGADTFRLTSNSDSIVGAMDTIDDFQSSEDKLEFAGMAGIEYGGIAFTYSTSVADTVASIVASGATTDALVYFTDGSDGYLYVKGTGSQGSTSYDGTLIRLAHVTTAPPISSLLGPVLLNIEPTVLGATAPFGAMQFDGIDDRLAAPLVITSGTGDVTIEARFNWSGATSGSQMIAYNGDTSMGGFGLYLNASGQIQALSGGVLGWGPTSPVIPTVGEWMHVALTREAGVWHMYVDGDEVTLSSTNAAINTPFGDMLIGANTDAGARESFNGLISDVAVWNQARSASDLADNYNKHLNGNESGLAGYWRLGEPQNGVVVDLSGNGNHAFFGYVPPREALIFDGIDDVVSVADSADLIQGTGAYTYEAWFNTSYVGSNYQQILFIGGGSGQSLDVYITPDGTLSAGHNNVFAMESAGTVNDGDWHHVAFTHNGAGQYKLFLDGTVVDTHTEGSTPSVEPGVFLIGQSIGEANQFEGMIGDVAAWDIARSPSDMEDYADKLSGYETGLAGYWRLGDAENRVVQDLSANGNNAALAGAQPTTALPDWIAEPALKFDGVNDRVMIAGGPGALSALTLEAWIRPDNAPATGAFDAIFAKGADYGSNTNLFLVWDNGKLAFYTDSQWFYGDSVVTPDQWNHVAVSYDPSVAGGTITFYIDGKIDKVLTGTGGSIANDTNIGIGNQSGYGILANPFDGDIADVRMWNDTRTADEIADFKNARLYGDETGLVGYWPLTADAVDYSAAGTSQNGTIYGAHFATDAPVVLGPNLARALDFDGNGDYITVADNSVFDQTSADTFTLETWLKLDQFGGDDSTLIDKTGAGNDHPNYRFHVKPDGSFGLYSFDGATQGLVLSAPGVIVTDTWQHLAVTYNAGNVTLYLNGIAVGTGTMQLGNVNSGPLYIGHDDQNRYLDGQMADVRFWDDVRSAVEIRGNMSDFVPSDSSALVANWRLDDQAQGTGATVDDVAGGYNGAVSGNPQFVTNSAPLYTDYVTTAEDVTLRGVIHAEDPDSTLTYTVHTDAAHGTLTIGPSGDYIYEPDPDYSGTDSFVVSINGSGAPILHTIHIEIVGDDGGRGQQTATTTTFTNTAGGAWDTAGNWSGGVPVAGVDAVIPSSVTGVVTHATGSHTMDELDVQSTLIMTGGSLTVTNEMEIAADFNWSGGDLTSAQTNLLGHLTVSGSRTLTGDLDILGAGTLVLASNSSLTLVGNLDAGISGGAAIITIGTAGTLAVEGTMQLGFFGSLIGTGTLELNSTMIHAGIIDAGIGDFTPATLTIDGDVTFAQYGEVAIELFGLNSFDTVFFGNLDLTTAGDILRLNFTNDFIPLDGQSFEILGYDSVTTASGVGFNTIHSNLASGYTFTVAYGTNAATITVHAPGSSNATAGNDELYGTGGADTIYGLEGNDTLVGLAGNDVLDGGAGDDTLQGDAGADTLAGGAGYDVFVYAPGDSVAGAYDTIVDFDTSDDKIEFIGMEGITFENDPYTFAGTVETTLSAIAGDSNIDNTMVFFTDGIDGYLYIKGSSTDALPYDGTFIKLAGVTNGIIYTNLIGVTQIHPVAGNDIAFFANGVNDTVLGSSGDDTIFVFGTAQSGDSVDLGTGTDTLTLAGDGNTISVSNIEEVYGGSGDDVIVDTSVSGDFFKFSGGAGQDYIDAGPGIDSLEGGAGYDTLIGGAGWDTFVSNVGGGLDTLPDFDWVTDDLKFNIPMSDFSYVAALNALVKTDTAQGFIFAAGSGMDDTNFNLENQGNSAGYIKSNTDNTAATLDGSANSDFLLLAGTTTGQTASGDAGNDRIQDVSNNGNILQGGTGADILIGGAGADTIDLGADSDVDRVVYRAISDGGATGDVVTNFGSSDLIVFTDVASATILTLLDRDGDGNLNDEKITIGDTFVANYAISSLFVFDQQEYTSSNASDLNEVAAIISGEMLSSSGHTGQNRTSIFVVASVASITGIYAHIDANSDGIVTDNELSILAIVNGAALTVANFGGTSNDQTFIGTGGDDTISGGIDDDTFIVSTGTDIFYTGGGYDVMDFTGTRAGSTKFDIKGAELIGTDLKFTYTEWDSVSPSHSVTVGGHLASGFALDQVSFEFNDVTRTFDVAQTFNGSGLTADTLFAGTNGDDQIIGGSRDDILLGNNGDDDLFGGAGDDYLVGGAGNDMLDGGTNGAEGDTISFFSSPAGVIINLANGTASDGFGTNDIFVNFENAEGSQYADQITGDIHANTLRGESGDDEITGGLGADILYGGSGSDRFIYQSEFDSGITPGSRDRIMDFDAGTNGTSVDFIDLSAFVESDITYLGTAAFSGSGPAARIADHENNANLKILEIDTDGDMNANMQIEIDASVVASLDADDFVTGQGFV